MHTTAPSTTKTIILTRNVSNKFVLLRIAAVIYAIGLGFSLPCASATVLITNDRGGPLGAYLQRYSTIRDSGERVIIDGPCLSACTVVLALVPARRICLTSRALLGFHAAVASEEYMYPGAGSAATRTLFALYPDAIRRLIVKKGGLSAKMIFLTADDLFGSYSRCDPSAN